jgi:hypothetical protein
MQYVIALVKLGKVSIYRRFGTTYTSQLQDRLNIDCPETSVTITVSCVTSQKSEYLIYTTAEASNHA